MQSFRFTSLLLSILLVSACTSAPKPYTYNPDMSLALNIATIGNLNGAAKLKDLEVPKDTVTRLISVKTQFVGSALTLHLLNALDPAYLGITVASMFFDYDLPVNHPIILAWMPKEMAGDNPRLAMLNVVEEATRKAVTDLGFDNLDGFKRKTGEGKIDLYSTITALTKEEGDSDAAAGYFFANHQLEAHTPTFVGSTQESYAFIVGKNSSNAYVYINNSPKKENELELLTLMSKHLPKWVYLYVPPKKFYINEKDKLKIPLILNEGKAHYFVKEV